MLLFGFYRFYLSLTCGALIYLFVNSSFRAAAIGALLFRLGWFFIERTVKKRRVQRAFNRHIYGFKQHCGPYGIRIANKAADNPGIKESLVEVFEDNPERLKKNMERLEVMDTLFKAGLRPEGDEFLLHDLKLKYGKYRLENDDVD